MRITKLILLLCLTTSLLLISTSSNFAQEPTKTDSEDSEIQEQEAKPLSAADTVKEFYRLLREKQYLEGFRLSVYRDAIEGLTPEELKELESDFELTFSRIPETVKILGTQIIGNNATIFIKSSDNPKDPTADEVFLIQVNGNWVVGDLETLQLVKNLGRKFFPEIKIRAHEDAALIYMERYIGAQKLYSDANKGIYGSMEELVAANFWPPSLKSGEIEGYKFSIELGKDKKEFWIHAEPLTYDKTGRLSFYADLRGVYKLNNGGEIFRGPQSLEQ